MLWGEKPLDSQVSEPNYPYFYAKNETADDIAIIGGGVASFFVALSLLEKGKQVTLYCKDETLAINASGNLQGAIYPQLSDDDERNVQFYIHSFDYALQRLQQLKSNIEFEHNLSGVVLYAYDEKTAKKLEKMVEQTADDTLLKSCSQAELSEKLGLSVPNSGAFIPQAGWLSPVQLVRNGFTWLEQKGLKIVLNHKVEHLTFSNECGNGRRGEKRFDIKRFVLANGHTLNEFSQANGIPLYPVRGQVSQIPTTSELQN
ncbi:tRNA 5-methylaminomethyl-2-thiouridine biosynthesis bifunctional protein MnmC [Mannheimia haemolytica]|nr:tRNA 5-methylaminomethyl-2-thiouridine biosynthesis bifunctional protein MnmC [Mannheimia haemolytica]